jgi:cardiolipin synthase
MDLLRRTSARLLARWHPPAPVLPAAGWDEERVWHDGDGFFAALIAAIAAARTSIDLETYIYADDALGAEVAAALAAAVQRGVAVRLLVDAIGSLGWLRGEAARALAARGVALRVYHPVPILLDRTLGWHRRGLQPFFVALWRINTRNHRKACVIDGGTAFVGSMNVSGDHLVRLKGDAAWRDVGARVSGPAVAEIAVAFARVWRRARPVPPSPPRTREPAPAQPPPSGLVRINASRRQRMRLWRDLAARIRHARSRVWLATAYFVPRRMLLRALVHAAKAGRDVRLIMSIHSDVVFMPLVAGAVLERLDQRGVRVFAYQPRMLHAKSVMIDGWATVGSSNLNHRSALHDLEVDVVLTAPASLASLERGWDDDLAQSRELGPEDWRRIPRWKRWLGRLLLFFRYWL